MFCPNCGVENKGRQGYCRSCGLKLEAISQVVADQFPSEEYAALQRRRRIFERLGLAALSIAGLIGLMLLLFQVGLYKLIMLGPEVLFGSSIIALMIFLLLSVVFFVYPKLFMRFEKINPHLSPIHEMPSRHTTGKLLEDKFFEPVPGVTDDTTDLLPRRNTDRRS